MTHGGFYGHFASKEALAAEAAAHALMQTANRWQATLENRGMEGLERLVDAYLSQRHIDAPGSGCAIAALGPELARQAEPVRPHSPPSSSAWSMRWPASCRAPTRPSAAAGRCRLMAQMVGAIVLARAFGRSMLAAEVLEAVRQAIAAAGTSVSSATSRRAAMRTTDTEHRFGA